MRYHAPGDPMNDWVIREEHAFWTQRAPGSPFAFTIIADSHMSGGFGNVSLYQQTLDNVRAEHPDFHLDLGDTFWTDGVTSSTVANQRYLAQRQWMGVVSHSSPIFLAPGNHENEEGWNCMSGEDTIQTARPGDSLLSVPAGGTNRSTS
jgi:hypothetical protein